MSSYLIFGGTGSLGKELIKNLTPKHKVYVYSRDEAKHWTIKISELNNSNLKFIVGDVRDKLRVNSALNEVNPDYVIIASALKQVDTCEFSPTESIATNILGTQNIIECINNNYHLNIKSCCFVSTDKAASPINVYGMCKAISERLTTSQCEHNHKSTFVAVRYGNVLESRGSIIPLFKYQCQYSDTLTVTDPDMTRYVMTLQQSVELIKNALLFGKTGTTIVSKLPSMRIGDLAEIFSELYNKKIKVIGVRPGEKLHETLISDEESIRTQDLDSRYKVISSITNPNIVTNIRQAYSSDQCVLSKDDLKTYLQSLNIFDIDCNNFPGLSIEEIRKNV